MPQWEGIILDACCDDLFNCLAIHIYNRLEKDINILNIFTFHFIGESYNE